MAYSQSNDFHHYEVIINEKDYHITYQKSEDKVILRVFQQNYKGAINKLPKIFEREQFSEWVEEMGYLTTPCLDFREEEESWMASQEEIPFKHFINNYDKMVEALLAFVDEFCEVEL